METGTLKELNVKPGDVVECIVGWFHATKGEHYTVNEFGDIRHYPTDRTNESTFRIISRASDTPKTWGEMTDAEKGALLLAAHEGKVIEHYSSHKWIEKRDTSNFSKAGRYRVKPEPKRETVEMQWSYEKGGKDGFAHPSNRSATHRITFDTIDGEPDCASVKMEKL